MIIVQSSSFAGVYAKLRELMREAPKVEQLRWQGIDVRGNRSATSYELRNVVFEVDLRGVDSLDHWKRDINPNLPWADDHFAERVGGQPLNPGVEWQNWPWGRSAARFRDKDEMFNHTYMERFWPKYARMTDRGEGPLDGLSPRRGIAQEYGDLRELVNYLAREPSTRQAWIPLFFPEDTGYGDGGRKPCTLGYQFLVRDREIHIWYPLRSCDLTHHFHDDCYLAVRLLVWVLQECRKIDSGYWGKIRLGTYGMHITSLHVFENDIIQLRKEK